MTANFNYYISLTFIILSFKGFSQTIKHSTLSSAGGSDLVEVNGQSFHVAYSIGQQGIAGYSSLGGYSTRQGFIQPPDRSIATPVHEAIFDAVVHPTPFTDFIHINIKNDLNSNIYVKIYDLSGRVVFSDVREVSNLISFDLSTLPSAQYILELVSGNYIFNHKILKR